jgi:pimeloyl-ACP methyl ester carboxylesterase
MEIPMKKEIIKKSIRGLVYLALVFMTYVAVLYSVQYKILFVPDRYYISPSNAGVSQFNQLPVVMVDGQIVMNWYYEGEKEKPAILFFHGNAGQIATFAPFMSVYTRAGYTVLMMEYRGYGKTCGISTQDTMNADGIWVYDYLKNELGHEKIILFGYSMGTSVASAVARFRAPSALILEAPFASMYQLVGEKPIPFAKLILKDYMRSDEYIKEIAVPLFIMHGEQDRLIPYHHAKILYRLSPSEDKTIEIVSGETHDSLFFTEKNQLIVLDWLADRFR